MIEGSVTPVAHPDRVGNLGVTMPLFGYLGADATGDDRLDYDISEMLIYEGEYHQFVVAFNGPSGGISTYSIADNGALTLCDSRVFGWGLRALETSQTALVEISGRTYAIVGASSSGDIYAYRIGTQGGIGSPTILPSSAVDFSTVRALLTVSEDGDSAGMIAVGIDGSVQYVHVAEAPSTIVGMQSSLLFTGDIVAIDVLDIGGTQIVLALDQTSANLRSYQFDPTSGTATLISVHGAVDQVGLGLPEDFTTVTVSGATYVVVASPGSGSLTVFSLSETGDLAPVDHVLDTSNTNFANASHVDSFDLNGVTFIVAAGADNGLSLLTLTPEGRLILVESLTAYAGMPIYDPASLVVDSDGGQVMIYLSSESQAGLLQFSFDTVAWTGAFYGGSGADTVQGQSGNQLLDGGAGNDTILGGSGDDILVDGAGTDTLAGGDGRDVFVFDRDGDTDTISDFRLGYDRIDLSAYPMVYTPSAVDWSYLSGGIRLMINGEQLNIYSHDGYDISFDQLMATAFVTPHRPMLASSGMISGSTQADVLSGSIVDDMLDGGAGGDIIYAGDGNDVIYGGDGADTIYGGIGDDIIYGDAQYDLIFGEEGNDIVYGGSGQDTVYLGEGDDTFYDDDQTGTHGRDTVYGGSGRDVISGGGGNDVFYGGTGSDRIYGGADNDSLFGEEGWDRLYGQEGDDMLDGGAGTDYLYGGLGNDTIYGGADDDIISGNEGDDTLYGDADADRIYGGSGADRIEGGDGRDRIYGQDGDDVLLGGDSKDYLYGAGGNDRIDGGTGDDVAYGGDGWDRLWGGGGDDHIYGEAGVDRLYGQEGNDTLDGGLDADYLYGGLGNDTVFGGDGDDIISGNEDNDSLFGDDGTDRLYGGTGNDAISGGVGSDRLYGQEDDDSLAGESGRDFLYGGDGNDRLDGGTGDDFLTGGTGVDSFVFAPNFGKDTVNDFELGVDVLEFGVGVQASDIAYFTSTEGYLVITPDGGDSQIIMLNLTEADIGAVDMTFV